MQDRPDQVRESHSGGVASRNNEVSRLMLNFQIRQFLPFVRPEHFLEEVALVFLGRLFGQMGFLILDGLVAIGFEPIVDRQEIADGR